MAIEVLTRGRSVVSRTAEKIDGAEVCDSSELLSCCLRDGRSRDESAGMRDSSGRGRLPDILSSLNSPLSHRPWTARDA
jgi:hypothetical protein